jgi:hypothetical protein
MDCKVSIIHKVIVSCKLKFSQPGYSDDIAYRRLVADDTNERAMAEVIAWVMEMTESGRAYRLAAEVVLELEDILARPDHYPEKEWNEFIDAAERLINKVK